MQSNRLLYLLGVLFLLLFPSEKALCVVDKGSFLPGYSQNNTHHYEYAHHQNEDSTDFFREEDDVVEDDSLSCHFYEIYQIIKLFVPRKLSTFYLEWYKQFSFLPLYIRYCSWKHHLA